MILTLWYAESKSGLNTPIITRTRKEAKARAQATLEPFDYSTPAKVEFDYRSGYDLFTNHHLVEAACKKAARQSSNGVRTPDTRTR